MLSFPEQAFTKQELEDARDTAKENGLFDGLSTFEKLKATLDVARCRKMGGQLFHYTNGHLEQVNIEPKKNETS